MSKGACWKSSLNLYHQDDDKESLNSAPENYGDPKETPVGPFMHGLFQNQLYTDVEFAFKGTKECLSAHRVVLAAKCEFFADLLFGDKKNSGTGTKMRIEINNIPFTIFKGIVNYFYTDDIDFPDLSTVLDIHSTANSFKIQSLINLGEQYISEFELTEDNACSTLQISNSKFADNLKNRCIDFIKNHTPEVISSPDFEKSSFNTMREIANLQDLNLRSESEMLEAVLRWINVQPDHAKAELRKSLLKCIRFINFAPKEFRDVIKLHSDLLTSGEALDTLIYLNDPTPKNMKGLPDWMNRSRRTFSQDKKKLGIKEIRQINSGKLEIPLIAASGQQKLASLTSFLKLKSINSYKRIKGVKILLEDISNDGDMTTVIVLKAYVIPGGYHTSVSRTIDSRETEIKFPGLIVVQPDHLLNLEAQIYGCQSCKFFQFDTSKEKDSEYFQYSVSSKPKQESVQILPYSDDSAMTYSVASSIVEKGEIDAKDMAKKFVDEFYNQPKRGYGMNVIDVFKALRETNYEDVFLPAKLQFNGSGSYGNGAAMRIAPIALFGNYKGEQFIMKAAEDCARVTHTHQNGINGAILQCLAVNAALGLDSSQSFDPVKFISDLEEKMDNIETKELKKPYCESLKKIKEIHLQKHEDISSEEIAEYLGHDVSALRSVPTAIYSFLRGVKPIEGYENTNPFLRTLYCAISVGGDTDTIASMAGSIAGAYYGVEMIPEILQKRCEYIDEFVKLADKLFDTVHNK